MEVRGGIGGRPLGSCHFYNEVQRPILNDELAEGIVPSCHAHDRLVLPRIIGHLYLLLGALLDEIIDPRKQIPIGSFVDHQWSDSSEDFIPRERNLPVGASEFRTSG